jgi:hypothetical protein
MSKPEEIEMQPKWIDKLLLKVFQVKPIGLLLREQNRQEEVFVRIKIHNKDRQQQMPHPIEPELLDLRPVVSDIK